MGQNKRLEAIWNKGLCLTGLGCSYPTTIKSKEEIRKERKFKIVYSNTVNFSAFWSGLRVSKGVG